MRIIPTTLLLFASACATTGAARDQLPDPGIAKALAGKVAGAPLSCISLRDSEQSSTFRGAILYRVNSKLTYLNDLGKCPFLRNDAILVTKVYGSQLCRGDIVNMLDRGSHFPSGSCVFSDFVPYRAPDK